MWLNINHIPCSRKLINNATIGLPITYPNYDIKANARSFPSNSICRNFSFRLLRLV